jgi:hypothetical protein
MKKLLEGLEMLAEALGRHVHAHVHGVAHADGMDHAVLCAGGLGESGICRAAGAPCPRGGGACERRQPY